MTSQPSPAIARPGRAAPLRSWRTTVGLTAAAGGATIAAGAFLPWVSAFAGLIQVPGVRGSHGRILRAAGILQAPNRAPGGLRASLAGLAAGEPHWLAALDQSVAAAVAQDGTVLSVLLAALFVVIAVAIYVPAVTRPALLLSIIIATAIWAIGENFGGILTGQATDPNTGPLLVLLAFAFWPLGRARSVAARPPLAAPAGQVVGAAAEPM